MMPFTTIFSSACHFRRAPPLLLLLRRFHILLRYYAIADYEVSYAMMAFSYADAEIAPPPLLLLRYAMLRCCLLICLAMLSAAGR